MITATKGKLRIAIFGGSFDPVHKGHILAAQTAIRVLGLNKLIYLPIFSNPWKKPSGTSAPARERLEILKKVCTSEYEDVSSYSLKPGVKNFTYYSMRYFAKKYPTTNLYLLIGSDCLNEFKSWKHYKRILKLAKLVVFKREDTVDENLTKELNASILDNEVTSFSSTKYRRGDCSQTTEAVQEYIAKKFLYIKDILEVTLSSYRFEHSLRTAELAKKLAKKAKCSGKRAYYAGLMHDLAKEWSFQRHQQFLSTHGINLIKIHPHEYHQISGYLWLKNVYLCKDKDILKAISVHTTLDLKLNKLDKVLFIADKISKFPPEHAEKLMEMDFLDLFALTVQNNYRELKEKKVYLTHKQIQIYEKWSMTKKSF